ncbi:MAG: alpha-ketoglutarate transporter, partial [Devosia sp.]|nr:alpha-ketoglutarate transporter [Devosia sp.]
LPYACAVSIFGGTAPFVALWCKGHGIETAFYWYVSALICGSALVYAFMGDTKKTSLIDRD